MTSSSHRRLVERRLHFRPDPDDEGSMDKESEAVQVARVAAAAQVTSTRWLAAVQVRGSKLLAEAQKQHAEAQKLQAESMKIGAITLMVGLAAIAFSLVFGLTHLSLALDLKLSPGAWRSFEEVVRIQPCWSLVKLLIWI